MKTEGSYSKSPSSPPTPRKKGRVLLRAELLEKHLGTVEAFDKLPDSAMVPNGAVAAVEGLSMPTFWSWVKKGRLPKPRIVDGLSRSNVGEVRQYRASRSKATA